MSPLLVVLYALVVPYLLLMLLVVVGILRREGPGPDPAAEEPAEWPSVDVILPARDEAEGLPAVLTSLTDQDYPGRFTVWVVDDRSRDGTAAVARGVAARDARVRVLRVELPSCRYAPKVNAVMRGVHAGDGEWIVTTDADCVHPRGWLRALLRHRARDVVMVLGHVDTAAPRRARGLLGRVEALDWTSLMLTSRALVRFGWSFASSANNQAYPRSAFDAVGGFGVAARAPSGDEDLLAQRLGRLRGGRFVFTDHPDARVVTAPQPSWAAFLAQRRRWVSRYQHLQQYRPAFLIGIALLGLQSLALATALLALPLWPAAAAAVLGLWAAKLGVETVGMHLGLARLGRRDLMGWPVLAWAALHPFMIATALVWSLLAPGSWRAGARGYRRRLLRAGWRRWRSQRLRAWRAAAGRPRAPLASRPGRTEP
jgi:cellulose synthase/poly-beta-1,6-N-acetylglucosamine synthase-like glycosyltransferase